MSYDFVAQIKQQRLQAATQQGGEHTLLGTLVPSNGKMLLRSTSVEASVRKAIKAPETHWVNIYVTGEDHRNPLSVFATVMDPETRESKMFGLGRLAAHNHEKIKFVGTASKLLRPADTSARLELHYDEKELKFNLWLFV